MICLAKHWGNCLRVTLGSDCVWVQERREGEGVLGRWVGGEDVNRGEQEDRSPMASRTSCQIQVTKLQHDTEGGKWPLIGIINVISLSERLRQTSVCHPGCCWPAITLSITAWEQWRWQLRRLSLWLQMTELSKSGRKRKGCSKRDGEISYRPQVQICGLI